MNKDYKNTQTESINSVIYKLYQMKYLCKVFDSTKILKLPSYNIIGKILRSYNLFIQLQKICIKEYRECQRTSSI